MRIMKITIKVILILIFTLKTSSLFSNESHAIKIGNDKAKITVKVFSSLTCPHCATFHLNIFERLKKDFVDKDKVLFIHYGFPLDLAALNGEKLLRCGNNQNDNLNFLSEIYKKQRSWAVGSDINSINDSLMKIGKKYNLDNNQMNRCLKNESIQEQVLKERIDAQKKYRIDSTPTIFINEKKYSGKFDYKTFKKEIEKLL